MTNQEINQWAARFVAENGSASSVVKNEKVCSTYFKELLASTTGFPLLPARWCSPIGFVTPKSRRLHSLALLPYVGYIGSQDAIYRLHLDRMIFRVPALKIKAFTDAGIEAPGHFATHGKAFEVEHPCSGSEVTFERSELSSAVRFAVKVAEFFDSLSLDEWWNGQHGEEMPSPDFERTTYGGIRQIGYVWSEKAAALYDAKYSHRLERSGDRCRRKVPV